MTSTTLSYGIDDVVKTFSLTPTLTGLVTSSIMIGTIVGNLAGGWLTDKYGRYSVFMADMLFSSFLPSLPVWLRNVWVMIGARFLMGIGVGMDLPVAMAYLAEFSKFSGKGNSCATGGLVPDVVCRLVGLLFHHLRPLLPVASPAH